MSLYQIIFYIFCMLAAVSAVGILITKDVLHAVLMLLVCLMSVAGLYVLLYAEFVAITQILIYAGGVLVVIMFGIMLTTKISGKALMVKNSKWLGGILVGGSLCTTLIYYLRELSFQEGASFMFARERHAINIIGIELMSDFVLPFELAGVLLLVALIGAAVISSTSKKEV